MMQMSVSQVIDRLKDFYVLVVAIEVDGSFEEVYRFERKSNRALCFREWVQIENYELEDVEKLICSFIDESDIKLILESKGNHPRKVIQLRR